MQRGGYQPVKCKRIAGHIRTLLEIDVPGERLDVHHGRVGGLVEVQDDERPDRPGMRTRPVGHDLDRGLPLLCGLGQMAELPAHHADAADDTMDNRLVDHGPQPRPVLAGQDLLPGQADFHAALDLLAIQFSIGPFLKISRA